MDTFDKILIAAIKKDRKIHKCGDFDLNYVKVKHEDGSEYKITHAKIERIKVDWGEKFLDCIIVYPEHNTISMFVEIDLEEVVIKPWKGKEKKLKLQKC